MKIIKTSEALPKSGRYVLAWLEGAKIPMRAMWADQHTLPLGDDADPEWGEYSEEKDEYFCPAGWYEMNQFEEQHWGVSGNVVAWCELPRLDHQCLAQIEEPAQPVCWIRFCSDGSTEGPIMDSRICEARKTSGAWTPLYAGAAPAAVAPLGEYPQLPKAAVWSVAGKDGMPTLGKGWMFSPVQQGNATLPLFTADQLRAYYDLGRQAAPALEAPAAPAGDEEAAFTKWFQGEQGKPYQGMWEFARAAWMARAAAPQAPNCTRCSGSGEDPEGYLTHGHGPDDHTVDGPCRECDGTGAAPQAPAAPSGLPHGWVPCILTHDGQHPEEVAYGPQIMMDRLKKWLGRYFELLAQAAPAAPAVDALSQAARDVLAERQRQISAEGYEPEADAMYESGELARAAATYALLATGDDGWRVEDNWPWGMSTLKRADPRRMLEKAGALILADMERIDRAAQAKEGGA